MQPFSTGVRLASPPLVIHPSRFLPLKRSIQPSAFSFSDNALSPASAAKVSSARARRDHALFIANSHPFVKVGGPCPVVSGGLESQHDPPRGVRRQANSRHGQRARDRKRVATILRM